MSDISEKQASYMAMWLAFWGGAVLVLVLYEAGIMVPKTSTLYDICDKVTDRYLYENY